jgi:hypothetical protein
MLNMSAMVFVTGLVAGVDHRAARRCFPGSEGLADVIWSIEAKISKLDSPSVGSEEEHG